VSDWPFLPVDELREMACPQVRLLVGDLCKRLNGIDRMKPGLSRDQSLGQIITWLDKNWPAIPEAVRRKALEL